MSVIKLPEIKEFTIDFIRLLKNRESRREYPKEHLSLDEVSYLLFSCYGKSNKYYVVPSAGALFPLNIYLLSSEVKDLDPCLYLYDNNKHSLILKIDRDLKNDIYNAALAQDCIKASKAIIFITAVWHRITSRYGQRGVRYTYMEAGHSGQNIYLMAEALGLGTVAIGAFADEEIDKILNLDKTRENCIYFFPVGRTKKN
ncbi:MAG: SagB/ThcOx family dehydrogenase [Candidatus Hydrogenedentota bacterium]